MLVNIDSIDQKVDLKTSEMTTCITIQLPNGQIVQAMIEEKDAQEILNLFLSKSNLRMNRSIPEEPDTVQEMPSEIAPEAIQDDRGYPLTADPIKWAELPDSVLPAHMKQVLSEVGAAPIMPLSDLTGLVGEITERMEQDVNGIQVVEQPKPVEPIEEPKTRTRKIGEVYMQKSTPRQTVPQDDHGYPIVNKPFVNDPGEIAMGVDEDGVGQL